MRQSVSFISAVVDPAVYFNDFLRIKFKQISLEYDSETIEQEFNLMQVKPENIQRQFERCLAANGRQ